MTARTAGAVSVAAGAAQPGQYLTFRLAGEEYAIPILRVREIVECSTLTRVPGAAAFIRGVVNRRGTILPVVDLAVKLGLGETAITKWTCVVMVDAEWEGETTSLGVMTDAMNRVLDLGPGDLEAVPSFGVPVRLEYLLGMGRCEARFVLILDVDRVLSREELTAVAAAEAAVTGEGRDGGTPFNAEPASRVRARRRATGAGSRSEKP